MVPAPAAGGSPPATPAAWGGSEGRWPALACPHVSVPCLHGQVCKDQRNASCFNVRPSGGLGWELGGCLPHHVSPLVQEAFVFLGPSCVSPWRPRLQSAGSTQLGGERPSGGCSLGALGPESAAVPGGVPDGCPLGLSRRASRALSPAHGGGGNGLPGSK